MWSARLSAWENPLHYRNKVQAAFGTARNGKIVSGVYQSSTHRIVPVDSCMIEDETADAIIVTVRRLCQSFGIPAYNEHTCRGFLRHVLVKRGFSSGQIMVVLVGSGPVFPDRNHFVKAAAEGAPHHHHHPAQYQSLSYQSRAGRAGEDIVWTGKN